MSSRRKVMTFVLLAGAALGVDAWAIVGMPATPLSFAGVARRSVYRAGTATAYAAGAAAGAATAATIATLPAGCTKSVVNNSPYYNCAGTYYRPSYNGPDVVYVQTAAP